MYTARTSKQWENDIALSATHFPDLGLTVAVVYGCSEDQLDEFGRRVRKGAAYVEHPMLVVGIFAELERQRLKEKIEDLVDGFVMGTDSMNVETRSIREVMNADGERVSDILDIYNDARNFLKGLSAVKLQLRKMIKHVSELDHAGKRGRKSRGGEGERVRRGRVRDTGELIRERLVEISEEHDASIEDCRMVMEDIPIHAQMVRFHCSWHQQPPTIISGEREEKENDLTVVPPCRYSAASAGNKPRPTPAWPAPTP